MTWALALGVLGAILGSFIATLVIRWPAGRSVTRGRSVCDACGRTVSALDLVPILSSLWLRGRCRSCAAPIDPRHWKIELAAAAIGALAGAVLPGPAGAGAAVFGWLLLALGALDVAAFWLPDVLTTALAVTGLAFSLTGIEPAFIGRLIGGVGGFGALWLIASVYRLVRKRDGLGGGDPKMLGAIGCWVGWRVLPVVLVLACLAGLAMVLLRLVTGRLVHADDRLALGALLAIAAYPTLVVMLAFGP